MSRSQRSRRRRLGRSRPRSKALLAVLVVAVLAALGGLSVVGYVVSIAASTPALKSRTARDPGQNSVVLAADGQRLGFIQGDELRQPVAGKEIPESLKNATVAIEDERYWRHRGVDYEGVVRAAVKNVASRKTVQGGSTITMQLVRNLYISRERTYERKIREAKLAEELENEHSKEWILDQYLNSVPFGQVGGQTAIGVQAAARVYFSKRVSELELHESALLAGLPQAPSAYSPITAPEKAKARRDEVLAKMGELGMIKERTARRAMRRGLGTKPSQYFFVRREKYFFDYVKDQLIKEYGAATVRRGGLRVRTTIDLKKQDAARDAIAGRLQGAGPSSAIVTIDPRNGHIVAMASSAAYGRSKFNLAAQGHRQPGSTFKVMALMTALRKGVDPARTSYVSRSPVKIDDPKCGAPFEVKTYDGSSRGSLDLARATLSSDNAVYIQLAADLGPLEVKKTARDMGIRSVLKGYCGESLGGLERGVSPLEMATAYATIASGGFRYRPTAITKVTFPNGRSERPPRFKVRRTRVFTDGMTAKATDILARNMTSGTGTKAQIGCPAAGKTGTTDKHVDAWFVGYTPRLSTAVWVGYPKQNVPMTYEYGGGPVAGGTFPSEIWGDYMKKAKGRFCGDFKTPTQPFVASPFDGTYARSGAPGGENQGENGSGEPGLTGTAPTPRAPSAPAAVAPAGDGDDGDSPRRSERDGGGGGGGGDDDEEAGAVEPFDPGAYESPAQAAPDAGADPDGGVAAPDGEG